MYFKEGRELISQNRIDEYYVRLSRLQRGDAIDFGTYELSGGMYPNDVHIRMPITWIVLIRAGDDLLLLSEKALYWDFFDGSGHRQSSSWENSYVRRELNTDKLQDYFTDEERRLIKRTVLKGDYNPVYDTGSDYSVTDQLFLLTAAEVARYLIGYDPGNRSLAKLGMREKTGTTILSADRTDTTDLIEVSEFPYRWWLRTTGGSYKHMAVVTEDGRIDLCGTDTDADEIGIRPAMWIRTKRFADDDLPF